MAAFKASLSSLFCTPGHSFAEPGMHLIHSLSNRQELAPGRSQTRPPTMNPVFIPDHDKEVRLSTYQDGSKEVQHSPIDRGLHVAPIQRPEEGLILDTQHESGWSSKIQVTSPSTQSPLKPVPEGHLHRPGAICGLRGNVFLLLITLTLLIVLALALGLGLGLGLGLPASKSSARATDSLCPGSNNTITTMSGFSYTILCDVDVSNGNSTTLSSVTLTRFDECLGLCASMMKFQRRGDIATRYYAKDVDGQTTGTCLCVGGLGSTASRTISPSFGIDIAVPS